MPPSKSTGRSSRSKASTARKASSTSRKSSNDATREQLQRFLDPREVVVVTRERLQEALDEAVERGRMTRDDAGALLADLLQRGRKQTDDLREDIEGLLGGAKGATRKGVAGSADRVLREVDRARRRVGVGSTFPITLYDELNASQIQSRLNDLTPAQLRKVRDYEKRNDARKSVLSAIEKKLA
jgi:polyhydroxyalkanoate synthesis regulator phasin